MSLEMKEKKKFELETLEKQDKNDKEMIKGDLCPICSSRPTSYPYICFLPNPYGWLECVSCGCIYVPKSIRDQKIAGEQQAIKRPQLIVPGE